MRHSTVPSSSSSIGAQTIFSRDGLHLFPDGKRIAFQSNRTGRMEIWVMNVDGSRLRQVTGL